MNLSEWLSCQEITQEKDYRHKLQQFNKMLTSEFVNTPAYRRQLLALLSRLVRYEHHTYGSGELTDLVSLIRFKMAQMSVNQTQLAGILGVDRVVFNKVLNGHLKASLELIKRMHLILGIDGNYLLGVIGVPAPEQKK